MRFIVYTPIGTKTGGPTALHQLYSTLVELGEDAYILPTPDTTGKEPVRDYQFYRPQYISNSQLQRDDVLIIPEYITALPRSTYRKVGSVAIWWLSVDNSPHFYGNVNLRNYSKARQSWGLPAKAAAINRWRYKVGLYIQGKNLRRLLIFIYFQGVASIDKYKANVRKKFCIKLDLNEVIHLFQSEYARESVHNSFNLSGLMLTDFIEKIDQSVTGGLIDVPQGKPIIVFNGTKGFEFVQEVQELLLNDFHFLPLKGFNDVELVSIFAQSDLYLDLGHFPGKDRLPREALKQGCPIAISAFGAGGNPMDYSIPDSYKINMANANTAEVAGIVRSIITKGKQRNLAEQEIYRAHLLEDENDFRKEVIGLVSFYHNYFQRTN